MQEEHYSNSREIDLSGCGLTAIPENIFQLENLAILHLDNNYINQIPSDIGNLRNLRVLTLSGNQIKELPAEIGQLHQLRYLKLGENELSRLPKEIRYLSSLKKVDLNHNKFQRFPKILRQLKNLRVLCIAYGNFSELPEKIENLHKLKVLDLRFCGLKAISPSIAKIQTLEILRLSHNYLKSIPHELKNLAQLKYLDVNKNPLAIDIPPEILTKVGTPQDFLNYYYSTLQEAVYPLNEVKLLFVGQGSIGKTSLVNRITQNTFCYEQKKTEGISISRWKVLASRKAVTESNETFKSQQPIITINIWDFGGQEIMHATHQFFLTKRSLYLLVLDSRLTQEENRVEYWLKIIQSFGGGSPVLVVGNKIDEHPLDIDRTGLKKKYSNIIGFLETSAATGKGIEELKETIIKKVHRLRLVRTPLAETWFTVKTKLEGLGRECNFITYDKYLELCAENGITDESNSRTLIGFLHDLGVVLHFQNDPRLESLGILNPQWVTNGVYKIHNSHTLFQNKGVLTVSMLDEILSLPEYPRGKRLFIVDMMKKFELCYDIEPDKTFLVPDLLPKDEPAELKFNGVPAFEYAYPVLPSSVITRFIVRMNQKIDDGLVWRTGVVLKIGENKALVKADIEDRKITIAIGGVEHTRRDALLVVCTHLDEIHDSIKGLNPEKLIPVPGAVNAKPLSYNYLLMLEAKGVEVLPVPDGNNLIDVNLRKVLSGVPNEIRPKESGGNVTHIHIGGNFDGNLTVGDGNQSIKDSYNKITTAKIDPELKDTLQQLVEAVEAMTKSMPEEQSEEVTEDLGKLVDEASKPKPNKRWYSVSIEGLIKAAENVEKVGVPVINLSRKVLSLLTAGLTR